MEKFFVVFLKFLSLFSNFILISSLSKYLEVDEFGLINYILFLSLFIGNLSDFGISKSSGYHYVSTKDKNYIAYGLLIKLFINLILSLVILFVYFIFNLEITMLYLIPLLIFQSLQLYFSRVSIVLGKIRLVGVYIPLIELMKVVSVLFIFQVSASWVAFLLMSILFSIIGCLLSYFIIFGFNYKIIEWSNVKNKFIDILKHGRYFWFGAISLTIYSQSDTLLVKFFEGYDQVAFYSIVIKLAGVAVILSQILNILYNKKVIDEYQSENLSYLREIFSFLIIIYIFISINIFLFSKDIILLIFGEDYLFSEGLLKFYSIYIFFNGLMNFWTNFLDNIGYGKKRSKLVLYSAVSNLILNVILIPKFGVYGAVFSTQLTYSIYSFIVIKKLLMLINYKIKLNKKIFKYIFSFLVLLIILLTINYLLVNLYFKILLVIILNSILLYCLLKNNITFIKKIT